MKTFLRRINGFIKKSTEKDSVLIALSVMLAVITWFYITNSVSPDAEAFIDSVPIDYEASLAGTPAEAEGYRIYDAEFSDVDIRVAANRKKLGFLDENMFYAKISADNYSGEQPVSAKIQIFKTDDNDILCDYGLKDTKNNKVKVYFYKEITKTIDVTVKAPGITAAEGYKLKSLTCESVSVTGPEPYVNMISECVLSIPQNVAYDSRKSIPVSASLDNLTFLNEDGEDINIQLNRYFARNQFRINKSELTVMINISMVKNIDISYSLTDVPQYFDRKFIEDRLSLSPSSLSVSSDDPSIAEIDSLYVTSDQNISLHSINKSFTAAFDLDKTFESNPKLINDTNVFTSYVTFDSTGLEEKIFDGVDYTRFTIKNPYSSKYSAELVTQRLDNVTVIGPASDIAKITADDLTVEIDLSKSSVSDTGKLNPGINIYKVTFTLPDRFKNVWVYGEHSVEVNIAENYENPEVTLSTSQNSTNY